MKHKTIQRLLAIMTVVLCGRYADHEALSQTPSDREFRADKLAESVVDPTALTIVGYFEPCINGQSFQQDALTTLAGWQYVAYYDAKGHVCLARRKLSDSPWQFIRFEDYAFKHDDVHNTISVGICPKDGTIHLSFDHHNYPLHYRVSRKGVATAPERISWKPSLFGPVIAELEKGKPLSRVCYPRFWRTPEGGLQFCYRAGGSGGGDRMLVDYDPATGLWRNTRQIDSRAGTFSDSFNTSRGRCSYPNGYTYLCKGSARVFLVGRLTFVSMLNSKCRLVPLSSWADGPFWFLLRMRAAPSARNAKWTFRFPASRLSPRILFRRRRSPCRQRRAAEKSTGRRGHDSQRRYPVLLGCF